MREKPADLGDGDKAKDIPVDRERVRMQMRAWQDRVLDLTKSNPLIGLNRSRVTKLRIIAPDPGWPTRYGTAAILQEAQRSHLEIAPVSGAERERLIADIYRRPADVVEETKAVLR